jgi:transcription initiation factor IIE alpha subunit
MNNEPAAWMSNGKEFYVQKNYCPDFIPLYTHPVKELTDEEIMSEWEISKDEVEFARAILRKVQENG